MTNDPVGYLMNLAVGVFTVVVTILLFGCLAFELVRRPRFSLRTLLIAATALALFLGMIAASRP